ncbi:MAG TPA: LacI family DNA-binding transcriptional regulator [Terrimesophilobacter sp.]|nr:LacI family DNA-binding transcriptional regulator [Terrimesophilobacter sp.]
MIGEGTDRHDGIRTSVRSPLNLITAKDVAREAGVHPSTVSRSLDPDQMSRVKPETRLRVEEVAGRLGYRPDLTASSLRRQRTMTIGVLIPSFGNPIYGDLIHGINAELEPRGYQGLMIEIPDGSNRLRSALETLRGRRVDGIICATSRSEDRQVLSELVSSGMPVVLTLRWLAGLPIARVVNDDRLGGFLAGQHLVSLGHRKMLELPGSVDIQTFVDRSRGFRDGLSAAGIVPVEHGKHTMTPDVGEGRRLMAMLLATGTIDHVTAVFAQNDLLAIGAIEALRAAGLRCPQDVSVMGFNDSPHVDHLDPALSTIAMPMVEMGLRAGREILRAVNGSDIVHDVVMVRPTLVARASTATPSR